MALLKFASAEEAASFHTEFCGKPFTSMQEAEKCITLFVDVIEFVVKSKGLKFLIPDFFENEVENAIEIPTCPVCLESLDPLVTGILTTQCNHSFHCCCISQWNDLSCPVCRYTASVHLSPSKDSNLRCETCETSGNLWVCLICGNVGCGRYQKGHAKEHYNSSNHLFSLEVETKRVWDYAGDKYVHRLVQNKSDGKLIEIPVASEEEMPKDCWDSSAVMIAQLDSQRMFFEEKLDKLALEFAVEKEKFNNQFNQLQSLFSQSQSSWESEKSSMSKTIAKFKESLSQAKLEIEESKKLGDSLLDVNTKMQQEMKEKDSEIEDLKGQIQDLLFHLETNEKLESCSADVKNEISSGSIVMVKPKKRSGKTRK